MNSIWLAIDFIDMNDRLHNIQLNCILHIAITLFRCSNIIIIMNSIEFIILPLFLFSCST